MHRPAKAGDIPEIYDLMQAAFAASVYAGRGEIVTKEAKSLIMACIQRHGQKGPGGGYAAVYERDGALQGFLLGLLDRVYHVGDMLMATDLYFFCRPNAPNLAASLLLRGFLQWAVDNPKVIEIRVGVTDVLGPDWRQLGEVYEKIGFEPAGAFYVKRIER